jgi:hypothetical protein
MPCRDVYEPFLREAFQSVLDQTSAEWRLIVITHADDPTSGAAIAAVLAELGASDHPAIRLLVSEGRFVTHSLNAGMREATTPFVAVLHADDRLARRAIEALSAAIRRYPRVDYFHSARIYIDDHGRQIGSVGQARRFRLADFKRWGPVKALHCWRVAAGLAIGGMDESLGPHAADDYDFTWCLAEAGYTFRSIPEVLYEYRDHLAHRRLTTHVPLDVQQAELGKILAKHGLSDKEIEREISRRTNGYMREALFADEADRIEKEQRGFDIRGGWRQLR